jgi:hypothetical protein
MVIIKRAVRAGLASRLHHLNYGIAAGAWSKQSDNQHGSGSATSANSP